MQKSFSKFDPCIYFFFVSTLLLSGGSLAGKLIAISGGSGSGKSTLVEHLSKKLMERGQTVCIVNQDRYFDHSQQHSEHFVDITMAEKSSEDAHTEKYPNFDHPSSITFSLIHQQLLQLLDGQSIDAPIYNYQIGKSDRTEKLGPCAVILYDGIHAFFSENIRALTGYAIFVDLPAEERTKRRLERDELLRSTPKVLTQQIIDKMSDPMYKFYVEPLKNLASRIVSGRDTKSSEIIDNIVTEVLASK